MNVKKTEAKAGKTLSWQKLLLKNYPFLILAFVVILFGILTDGLLFSSRNIKNIAESSFQYLIGCMAALFIFAQGEQDFSLSANIALSAIAAAAVSRYNIPLSFVTAMAVGITIGCISGAMYAKLPIPVFFLTMCVGNVISGFLGPLTNYQSVRTPATMLDLNNTTFKVVIAVVFTSAFLLILMTYTIITEGRKADKLRREVAAARVAQSEKN